MKPTNPNWYLAALGIALGSWVLATVVAAGAWQPVRDATLTSTRQPVDAAGQSIAVFTDIVQPDRTVTCRATDPHKRVIEIPKATLEIKVNHNGDDWHLIGLLNEGSNGLKVACTPLDRRVDNATYAYATVTGFESRANAGKGIAILGSAIGVGLAALTFYTRRQRRIDDAQAGSTISESGP